MPVGPGAALRAAPGYGVGGAGPVRVAGKRRYAMSAGRITRNAPGNARKVTGVVPRSRVSAVHGSGRRLSTRTVDER